MEIIRVENLSKIYGEKGTEIKAVDNMNFSVNKGEFVAIIGASGSGKSTLLNLLGGIDAPSDGKVIIDGEDIFTLNDDKLSELRRVKIGFVFQNYNLIPVLTVEENINMPILLDDKKPDKEYINELIKMLGLEERKDHFPNQLSGGQQQRVSIGRALSNKTSIILADEPTGNLDKKNGNEVITLLSKAIKKYSQTLIVITHDMEIANLADRIIHIEDGKIVLDEVVKNGKV
jgi:putative ABC transport system ATP-binding protein